MYALRRARSNPIDDSFYGKQAVFSGSRLADALTRLREAARSGERNERDVDMEIDHLIERSNEAAR